MAADDLKSFTTSAVIGGLLMFSLLSFAITFMFYNNPTGLGDTNTILESSQSSYSSFLLETSDNADTLLNITSNTNPEVSQLGSRDVVSTSYSAYGSTKSSFETAKSLIAWVFTGTTGKLLLGVLGGIIGLLGFFFMSKFIRTGV